jgi:Ca-activated chloride channel homolog
MKHLWKIGLVFFILLSLGTDLLQAQGIKRHIREGNKHYKQEKFAESELEYRKALEGKKESPEGRFNLGNALYKQEKFDESARAFGEIPEGIEDSVSLAAYYHNLGNSLLQSQKIPESIEAYKQSLRHNPSDLETKYNLAYAQKLMNEQQDQNQNQNQQENDQEENEQQQQDQQDQQDQQKEQNKEEPRPDQISREDAERLLQAIENEEKQVQERLNEEKTKQQKIRVIRNW